MSSEFISPAKTALTFAFLFGGFHIAWSILVALGLAQALINFVFWAHMISVPVVVNTFDAPAFVTLVVVTLAIGALFGYFMAIIWNRLHRS